MSRSFKKTPIHGIAKCSSEKQDKRIWHQRLRTHNRMLCKSATLSTADAAEALMFLMEHDVSNKWSMAKDGKAYCAYDPDKTYPDRKDPSQRLPFWKSEYEYYRSILSK